MPVGQTQYPGLVDDEGSLGGWANDFSTTLSAGIDADDTTIPVVDTTGAPTAGWLVIDDEIITHSGKTADSFTGCVRGIGVSDPAIHLLGATVEDLVLVEGLESLRGAIIATQTRLGAGDIAINRFYASPSSGSAGAPTFRLLAASDIPDLSATYATAAHTHTFASLTSKPTTLAGYGITDAQPLDTDLTDIAALSANGLLRKTAGTWGMDSATYLTANQTITLSGDVSGSGTTAITTTIGASAVTNAMLAGSINVSKILATGTPDGTTFLRGDGVWAAAGGGSPGGSDTQIQFNNAGAFGGSAKFTFGLEGYVTLLPDDYYPGLTVRRNSATSPVAYAALIQLVGESIPQYGTVEMTFTNDVPRRLVTLVSQEFSASQQGQGHFFIYTHNAADVTWYEGLSQDDKGRVGVGLNLANAGSMSSVPAQFAVRSNAAARIGMIVRGAASQSANLTEWQDSDSGVSAFVKVATGIGATSSDGFVLQNPTAAAAGAQQWSPRLRLTGQGWKTDATAASQTVDWIIENKPVEGAASPTSELQWSSQVNGGGYTKQMFLSAGVLYPTKGLYISNSASLWWGTQGSLIFAYVGSAAEYTPPGANVAIEGIGGASHVGSGGAGVVGFSSSTQAGYQHRFGVWGGVPHTGGMSGVWGVAGPSYATSPFGDNNPTPGAEGAAVGAQVMDSSYALYIGYQGTATVIYRVAGTGFITSKGMLATAIDASSVVLTVRGAASQSANLQEWQNSTPTTVAFVSAAGQLGGLNLSTSASGTPGYWAFVGNGATGSVFGAVAVGGNASAGGQDSLALGSKANASGLGSIAIGSGGNYAAEPTAGHDGAIVIGRYGASTATAQLVIAGINDAYFGSVLHATPGNVALNAGGGLGTNIAGASLILAGGKGTGNAAGGAIHWQTSDPGSSGTTLQSLTTKLSLLVSGIVAQPYTYTAGGTTSPQTINKPSGSVNFAASDTSKVVTNSLVTTNSIIFCVVATNDTTMKACAAVPASGSFTIYADAAPTAETRVAWWVLNA